MSEFYCHISGCSQVFDTLEGYEHHYNALHRNVCSFCRRSFPSGHLLDIHISEWHDSLFQIMAEKQNMVRARLGPCCHTDWPFALPKGCLLSFLSVQVLGRRLCGEVQEQQRQEGSLGHCSLIPC